MSPGNDAQQCGLAGPVGPDQDDRGAVAGHGCIEIEGPRAGADLNLPPHFGGEWACGERDGPVEPTREQ